MKKIIIVLLIFKSAFIIPNSSQAQTFQWLTRMGGFDSDPNFGPDEWVRDIAVDADGNVYACGRIRPTADFDGVPVTTYGFYDLFVCKYDCHGNLVWVKTAGGGFDDYASALELDGFGHIYLTGRFCSTANLPCTLFDTIISDTHTDMFFTKLDTSGNVIWSKISGSGGNTGGAAGLYIVMDSNGKPNISLATSPGVIFPGWSTTEPNTAPYIARFDTSGNMESLFTPSANFSVPAILNSMDSQDNYILTGYWNVDSVLIGNQTLYNAKPNNYNMYVAKFSNVGNLQWIYMLTDTTATMLNGSLAFSTTVDSNDNIYVAGTVGIGLKAGNYVFTDPIPPQSGSPFLIKLNPQGQVVWATQAYCQYSSEAQSVGIKNNNYAAFSGTYNGIAVFGSDTLTGTIAASIDLFIAEVDTAGNMLGAVKLGCTGGYDVDSYVTKVDAHDNVYIAGNFEGTLTAGTHSVSSSGGYTDGFVAKYGFNCTTGLSPTPTLPGGEGVVLLPNPANSQITITASGMDKATVTISNMLGVVVYTSTLIKDQPATCNVSNLAAGMYVVTVSDGKTTAVKKLVKE